MNGIEKIIERINLDTDNQISELRSNTDARVKEIAEGFLALASQKKADTIEKGKAAAEERRERLGGVAQLEAKKLVLATKQRVIDLAFSQALEQLTELPENDYVNLIARLASEAAVTGSEQVILSSSDNHKRGEAIITAANSALISAGKAGNLTLSSETRDIKGGCFLKDGKIETNCSFETIVRLLREQLAADVAALLFE